jgi:hypothetical protein
MVNYWLSYCQAMDAAGYPVWLGAVFTRAWRDANQKTAIAFTDPRLAPYVKYLGRWGVRDPTAVASTGADASGAALYSRTPAPNGYGLPYIDTIAVEDTRPRSAVYNEPVGWKLVLDFYARARTTLPEAIEMATTNDFQENSGVTPSAMWGFSALDVCAYDNIWRVNAIDILYYATAPGEVRLSINGVAQAPKAIVAGRNRVQFAMANGAITAGIYRNNTLVPGTEVKSLPGEDINMDNQEVQDFTYRRVSSLRGAYAV